jgi:hypothetical protein
VDLKRNFLRCLWAERSVDAFCRTQKNSMDFIDEKVVKLTSSDNELFELPASAAKLSKLILEQLEGSF